MIITKTQNIFNGLPAVEIYPSPWIVEDSRNSLTPSMVWLQVCSNSNHLHDKAEGKQTVQHKLITSLFVEGMTNTTHFSRPF